MKRLSLFILSVLVSTSAMAKQETWYWDFALGPDFASYKYSPTNSSTSRTGVAVDLAFYFPVSQDGNTIIGPSLTGGSVGHSDIDERTHGALAFSFQRSFGTEPGEGFFLRGDLGIGNVKIGLFESQSGFSALAGAGYGFAVSEDTRVFIQARYEFVGTSDYKVSSFNIVFGPMF